MQSYLEDESRILASELANATVEITFPTQVLKHYLSICSKIYPLAVFHVSNNRCIWRVGSLDFISIVTCTWKNLVTKISINTGTQTAKSNKKTKLPLRQSVYISFPVHIGMLSKRLASLEHDHDTTLTYCRQNTGQPQLFIGGQFSRHCTVQYTISIPEWRECLYLAVAELTDYSDQYCYSEAWKSNELNSLLQSCVHIDAGCATFMTDTETKQLLIEAQDVESGIQVSKTFLSKKLKNFDIRDSDLDSNTTEITDSGKSEYTLKYLYWFTQEFVHDPALLHVSYVSDGPLFLRSTDANASIELVVAPKIANN